MNYDIAGYLNRLAPLGLASQKLGDFAESQLVRQARRNAWGGTLTGSRYTNGVRFCNIEQLLP